ncbi:MAG: DEAD/DEAH box helicase, partial [Chloroflexota bacterium]
MDGCTLVGQNAGFDLGFLAAQGVELSMPVFDTWELAKILAPYLTERNLTALTNHFGVEYATKHRALPDAHAAKNVFLALHDRALQLDLQVLGTLANLGSRSEWPLSGFFQDVVAQKLTQGLEASLGAALPTPALRPPAPAPQRQVARERIAPVERGQRQPVDVAAQAHLLGPDGLLAQRFPGFEHRTEQVAMLKAVAACLNEGDHLLVEAGTGTGKSMAYLLPALFYAYQNDTQVVVSTNTIALQEQIIEKDLPSALDSLKVGAAAAGLPSLQDVRYTQLKGRANYLCPRRWHQVSTGSVSLDPVMTARLSVWLATTQTGDRAELGLNNTDLGHWSKVSAAAENCPGNQCQMSRDRVCFLQKARKRAAEAHLLVVNHALLVSDLSAGNKVLPEYDYLIIDEAHHLEDVATDALGFRTSPKEYVDFLDRLHVESAGRPQGYLPEVEAAVRLSSPLFAMQGGLLATLAGVREQTAAGRRHVEALFTALTHVLR